MARFSTRALAGIVRTDYYPLRNFSEEEQLKLLAEKLDIPLADVYSTASFYKHFYFNPRGKNVVSTLKKIITTTLDAVEKRYHEVT